MLPTRRFLPLLLLLFSFFAAHAQKSGWQSIQENHFTEARTAFETILKQNPSDEPALTGLIFLAETVQDYESYLRYTNQLIRSGWQPHYVWLFGHLFDGAPEEGMRQTLPEHLRLSFALQQADTLFRYRRFEESKSLKTSVLPDWNWSVTGPFTNVAGSGFAETTPVENAAPDFTAVYTNETGAQFGWLRNSNREPCAPVVFTKLPPADGLSTYYANTFITMPAAQKVCLRITRKDPVKIWLDDQLLLERARPGVPTVWETETLNFELPAGTHRLLVKVSEFPEENADSPVRLEFNDRTKDGDESGDDYQPEANGNGGFIGKAVRRSRTGFFLRLTDAATGSFLSTLRTDYTGTYRPATQAWEAQFSEREYLKHFLLAAGQNPDQAWRFYLLAKAFAKYNANEDGEAYFVHYAQDRPASAFAKFLLAKFFDANDKGERAEALLSEMDTVQCPSFAEHYIRLQKINREQDEPGYIAALEDILHLSPTNWSIMSRYLEFLQEKGRKEQIKSYVQQFLQKHDTPVWKKRLDEFVQDESYKPEATRTKSDRDREKEFKSAQKRVRKTFSTADYSEVIQYFRRREKTADVLKTYDEVLSIIPWDGNFRYRKAAYLFEQERPDEALALLLEQVETEPYNTEVIETIGDVYIEKKQQAEALKWYRRAQKIAGTNSYGLAEKIEKIENKPKFNGFFENINLSEVAKDRSWQEKYPDAESVIGLYAQQLTYFAEEKRLETVRKLVVHVRNEAGAKNWTEADLRQIGNITSAKVLKKDGAVTSPDLGWGVAVFKNLQAGDIILVEGVTQHNMPEEIPGEMLDIGFVSWQAPVARASLELLLPKAQPIHVACNRLDCGQYSLRDTGSFKMLRWDWRDIAKMENEEAAPDNIDGAAWVMFGSAPDWSRVVQWYRRKTYARTDTNYEVLEQARQLIRPGMSEQEIVETLHTFITRDINYSYVSFLNSNYVPKKPGATLSGKIGDCKDVATLMIALLQQEGIPAWYTLVSTHTFSNLEPRPTLYVFNHAIVAYQLKDGQLRFADLTTDYFPTGVLPESDANAWALVIRDGETQLRRLPNHQLDARVTRVEVQAQASVDKDRNLLIDAELTRHGSAAGHWREVLMRATAEERSKKLSEYFGGGVLNHLDLEAIQFENLDSLNAPLRTRVRMTAYNQLDQVSNLYIMALPLPLSTPTQKALFAAKRYNDLDTDAFFELAPVYETVDLAFPAGLVLAELPKNQRIETDFGNYSLQFENITGGLRIRREVSFRQRFVWHTDFQAFKKFYLAMLDADDVKLAFVKS